MKTIQWFPGHMAKALRVLKEHLKMVDIVLELLDARIPYSSSNPELDKLIENKDRIVILNKKDLADSQITREWVDYYNQKAPTFPVNTMTGSGLKEVMEEINRKADQINERLQKRGRNSRNIRLMIIGIPNVGKSALINRLAKRSSAKVENRPGVTRGKQWIKVKEGLMLLDSPGILWPKFENQDVGYRLAATGAIRSEVLDEREVAYHLTRWLMDKAAEELKTFFDVEIVEDPYEMMLALGRKRGFLMSGGRVREEQTAKMILKEFRDGRIGQISLERPLDFEKKHETAVEKNVKSD